MFYSQFILAKKGPLGTIWIAAHLERKLRKNQVADTDIGVSVDSILFPEVPIALRLSSHLLLGVVRIYSRKVNYLFDDCSEALLKIKQAFRSTAVDLPPEESTAPYHSITLPETFDLDDFELPDNDFQGNYVDHHVSSKEQITLQDTMEGVVYSTSQFGLDERFGDGDTSGLDLDEELLVDNGAAGGLPGVTLSSDADPQASVQPMTSLKQDENQDTMIENSETMLGTGSVNQIEDFDGDNDPVEYAQAPCTPGLWEEPNLSNIQDTSAYDDHLESETHNVIESAQEDSLENVSRKSDSRICQKSVVDLPLFEDTNSDSALRMSTRENDYLPHDPEHNQVEPKEKSPASIANSVLADQVASISTVTDLSDTSIAASSCPDRMENLQNVVANPEGTEIYSLQNETGKSPGDELNESTPHMSHLACSAQPVAKGISESNQASLKAELSNHAEVAGDLERVCHHSNGLKSSTESLDSVDLDNQEARAFQSSDSQVLQPFVNHLNDSDGLAPRDDSYIHPGLPTDVTGSCSLETSGREEPPLTSGASLVQGEGNHAIDCSVQVTEETRVTEPASHEDIGATSIKTNQTNHEGDTLVENISSFIIPDLPAPEKLLSVPEGLSNIQNNLLLGTTPDTGVLVGGHEGDAGSDTLTGKKRSFTESSLTMQSLNSAEFSGIPSTKIAAESIPDDDDLLSSILVGRRSAVLKVKPTPPLETTSRKRRRSAIRASASKRKVLMDDTMVLHGDTIRQQLTNTEDIRRLRKKAPCTRPEISMIQKQFWEDELFSEALFTGVSMELASLYNQVYDPSKIRVFKDDASFESAMDHNLISQNDENGHYLEACDKDISVEPDVVNENGKDTQIPIAFGENSEAQQTLGPQQMHLVSNAAESRDSVHELVGVITAVENDGETIAHDNLGITALPVEAESSLCLDKSSEKDDYLQMDAESLRPDQKLDMPSVDMDASIGISSFKSAQSNVDAVLADDVATVEAGSPAKSECLLEQTDGLGTSGGFSTNITDCLEHIEISGSAQLSYLDLDMEENRKSEQDFVNEDAILDAEVDYNTMNLVSNGIYGEEIAIDGSYTAKVDMGFEEASLCGIENPGLQEAYQPSVTHVEISERNDQEDMDYSVAEHGTEFLNFDDDEVAEADGDLMPNAEETHFIDNSGWSSRTKAVAKYLQILFDKEEQHGREVLPIDKLLAGKTRKEASRMFFEALVLKTKDYIHVEQRSPFDNINMLPRVKLMKSDF